MDMEPQQNVEVAKEGGNVDDMFEVQTEAMGFEENGGEESSTSERGRQGEDGGFLPSVGGMNAELKRGSSDTSPRVEKNEGGKNEVKGRYKGEVRMSVWKVGEIVERAV